MKLLGAALLAAALVSACQSVRVEDTSAWQGRPVNDLDLHPVFLTMKLIKTSAADGTEIRNYVNGANVAECSGNSAIFGTSVSSAIYSDFNSCVSRSGACNNIFYIRKGIVIQYSPVGSGGIRCYTDETLRPMFRGATNVT